MKKLLALVTAMVVVFGMTAGAAWAGKPAGNHAGAVKYAWHLSGAVMPVPPYGSLDIPGSDTASKLIVNQPNGKVLANMTGVMNGLAPNTEYTVYLSNVWTPFVFTGWNVANTYDINVNYLSIDYAETLVLSQSGNSITGVTLDTVPPASLFTITGGSVSGNVINIVMNQVALVVRFQGTIAADGSMSGTWADDAPATRTGTWETTSGLASPTYTGTASWPGLLTGTVPGFKFMTDDEGSGSWHLNLRTNNITLPTDFSVWINGGGGTILISDPVHLY